MRGEGKGGLGSYEHCIDCKKSWFSSCDTAARVTAIKGRGQTTADYLEHRFNCHYTL